MLKIHVTNGVDMSFTMDVLAIPRTNELVFHGGKRYIVLQVIHHDSAVEVLVLEVAFQNYQKTTKETNANSES